METIFTLDIKSSVTKSVLDVFSTMLSIEIDPIPESDGVALSTSRIVGSVNFAGQVSGIININLSKEFSVIMATSMLGMSEDELEGDEEIRDVICEVSNIIGGNLKSFFNDAGFYCVLSTPSITKGDDFTIKALNTERYECLSFRYQQYQLTVEIGIKLQTGYRPPEISQRSAPPKIQQADIEKIQNLDISSTVIDSVKNVFDTMLSMEIQVADTVSKAMITGTRTVGAVGFAGDAIGLINIHVTSEFSKKMASVMLDMDIDEIDTETDVNDVIGEFSNIIGGNLKSIFADVNLRCELSTPSITRGSDFNVETMNMEVYERLAFEWMDYTFFVEFGLKLAEGLNISLNKGKDIRYQIADDSPPPISGWSDLSEPVKMPDSFSEKIEESIIQPEIAQPQFIQPETRQPEFIQPEIRKPETSPDPNSFYGWMEQAKAAPPVQTDVDLSLLLDIPLEISIQLGKTKMKINELLKIREQSVVGLDSLADEPVEILVNNKLIAKGEVIVEGGKYGIRVLEVLSRADRIKSLR